MNRNHCWNNLNTNHLVVDWRFCPKILDRWWGPTKAICRSVNVDGMGMVLAGGGDISTLRVIMEVV